MASVNPVTPTSTTPVVVTPSSASGGGDKIKNSRGRTLLRINNASGGSITATIAPVVTSRPGDGQYPPVTNPTLAITVAAGSTVIVGPFTKVYNDANDEVSIAWSSTTSVTFEAIEFQP
jgi:hypothetical protein